jgi:hypothetical protein
MIEKIARRAMSEFGRSGLFLSTAGVPQKEAVAADFRSVFLTQYEIVVIYVDLPGAGEPEVAISNAIKTHLLLNVELLRTHAGRYGHEVSADDIRHQIAGVGVGYDKTRTYAAALTDLSDATQKEIVMVINEVTLTNMTTAGEATLYALKAARDQLNGSAHHGFRLLATGSDRPSLSTLVCSSSQAFFCATLIDLAPMVNSY